MVLAVVAIAALVTINWSMLPAFPWRCLASLSTNRVYKLDCGALPRNSSRVASRQRLAVLLAVTACKCLQQMILGSIALLLFWHSETIATPQPAVLLMLMALHNVFKDNCRA